MPAQRGASVPGCGMFYRHIPACGDQCPALALGWPCENDTQAVSEMIMASIFHARRTCFAFKLLKRVQRLLQRTGVTHANKCCWATSVDRLENPLWQGSDRFHPECGRAGAGGELQL